MKNKKKNAGILAAVISIIALGLVFIAGTVIMGQNSRKDTERAVRSVSMLYLSELAGRREQVVSNNLKDRIQDMETAIDLLSDRDLKDKSSLEAYQTVMKRQFRLERFAFVDSEGLIYTSTGIQTDIDSYPFDYRTLSGPEISILNLESVDRKVIIATPVDIPFGEVQLVACFMQIDMQEMLSGVSMQSQEDGMTFCNIYTRNGIALSNTILGGLAIEDNLLEALGHADYEEGYSYEKVVDEFTRGSSGETVFTYNGIRETLSYVPVEGTDWLLTYLIRENVISEQINSITAGILRRSVILAVIVTLVLLALFFFFIAQIRKNVRLAAERETAEAENRIKQQELEQRIALQDELLEEQRQREQQGRLITAMASDYRIVYYVDLDQNDAVCYRADPDDHEHTPEGVHFPYHERFVWYAERAVSEKYREGFLHFIDPEYIRKGLEEERVLVYRYLAKRGGKEYYEMIRVAGVRYASDRTDHRVHAIGLGLTDIDSEMQRSMAQQQALSDALAAAEQASRAKTTFLSSMSHEIRTPMNAIIGLDSLALNHPETTPAIREYLQKIGGSADHLLNLINDILDMSRIESGRLTLRNEEFSFRKLLETINTMFSVQCADKGLEYHCRIDGYVDDYYVGDNMKMQQVLINILGNAVKFTPEGGKVELAIRRTNQYEGQSTLQFVISDTGIGMSREYLPHIFEAFSQEDGSTTNKYGSSGLGLAITKSIVEMMNGSIEVESEKGKGSTFTVNVTLMNSDRTDREAEQEDIHPEDMTVLVVDDDPVACEHAKLILEKAGIASDTAASGAEAIEMVRLRHARMEPYNLILVDWKMPDMDGIETTRQIRDIVGLESAIIILTAYSWDDVLEEALHAGVDSFLAKPLFAANVIEEFKTAMRRKATAAQQESKKADLNGRRVLIAEDVAVNAEILQMILQMRGMESELAVNGRIAVEKFAEHPAGYYDAILMDMRMPEMDGLEATKRIRAMDREDTKTIPIIALTANAFDEDVQRSMQAGLNAHLSKPVQPEILYETLENLIR